MYGRKHTHQVAALLTAAAALAFFAGSVQAANSRPAGMTKAEYRALVLRSEALNAKYGLGSETSKPAAIGWQDALALRSKALNAKYGLGSETSKPAAIGWQDALALRSKALNAKYGLGSETSKPAAIGWQDALTLRSKALNAKYGLGGAHVVAGTPPAVNVAENGFVWDDFAIGAAAMLGLVLVTTGVFAATRRIPRTRVSS